MSQMFTPPTLVLESLYVLSFISLAFPLPSNFDKEWSSFWGDRETERYAELDINLAHPIKLTRIAIRACLGKNKKGVVIITSSIAGVYGHFATALYVASKHGTIGLIKSLAKAEDEAQVKVVGICPG